MRMEIIIDRNDRNIAQAWLHSILQVATALA